MKTAPDTSAEFQLVARASGFLEAARIVADAKGGKTSLVAPIAHLVAHGLEVLMKHWLLRNGVSINDLRNPKKYGHQLELLWEDPKCFTLREAAQQEGKRALNCAKESRRFLDDKWPEPKALLKAHIHELSKLHSAETNYALRYLAETNAVAPTPLFLLDVFEPLKDRLARAYSRGDFEI